MYVFLLYMFDSFLILLLSVSLGLLFVFAVTRKSGQRLGAENLFCEGAYNCTVTSVSSLSFIHLLLYGSIFWCCCCCMFCLFIWCHEGPQRTFPIIKELEKNPLVVLSMTYLKYPSMQCFQTAAGN